MAFWSLSVTCAQGLPSTWGSSLPVPVLPPVQPNNQGSWYRVLGGTQAGPRWSGEAGGRREVGKRWGDRAGGLGPGTGNRWSWCREARRGISRFLPPLPVGGVRGGGRSTAPLAARARRQAPRIRARPVCALGASFRVCFYLALGEAAEPAFLLPLGVPAQGAPGEGEKEREGPRDGGQRVGDRHRDWRRQ